MVANVPVVIDSAGREHHGLARASLEIAAGAGRKAAGSFRIGRAGRAPAASHGQAPRTGADNDIDATDVTL
jgi:hypothetical protein